MHALATLPVAVVDPVAAYLFTREGNTGRGALVGRVATFDELTRAHPSAVFETGRKWQLVPAKLYRREDQLEYLRGQYPLVNPDYLGTVRIAELDAVGVFDRDPALPLDLATGNHVAELLLDASAALAERAPSHAVMLVVRQGFWLSVAREGRHVVTQALPLGEVQDAVFYGAALLEQFGLARESCPVFSAGLIAPGGQLHKELTIYFDLRDLAGAFDEGDRPEGVDLLLAYGAVMAQT